MFDLAWSEIALIAVVALVIIGPKDLPDAIRGLAKGIQKLRRMAGEFQTHVDEMVREAKLDEVRDQINQIRNFDFKGEIEKAVDADGSIRKTFEEDPFRQSSSAPGSYGPQPAGAAGTPTGGGSEAAVAGDSLAGAASAPMPGGSIADTFGPPSAAPAEPEPPPPPPGPPAFIPPEVVRAAEAAKESATPPAAVSAAAQEGPLPAPAPPLAAEAVPQPAAPPPEPATTATAPAQQPQQHRHSQTTI